MSDPKLILVSLQLSVPTIINCAVSLDVLQWTALW
jgi:hypothetical protein